MRVTPHAGHRDDRAGDPLDGLVNLFDLGIVLAIAFLLAALSSLHLASAVTRHGLTRAAGSGIAIGAGQTATRISGSGARVVGRGTKVGVVYRLANGELIYVSGSATSSAHH